jgi:hypothetical protein
MRRRIWLSAALGVLGAAGVAAQTVAVSNLDEATYQIVLSEERRNVFAANLALGPDERERFWAVYDEYAKERVILDKQRFALLARFAQTYANLSDDQAMAIALASGRLQISDVELRLKYAAILRKKMSGRVAARFFQIDDHVTTSMRMQSLSGIPLVAPVK